MEKELVRKLGEQIGYGNMMYLASECWKESMIKQGYPTTGVFIPALPCDVREEETYNDVPAGGLGKHAVTKSCKAILLTHDEAKYLNKVIRKKEEKEGSIAGYLLEILIKIENQFPDIKS